MKNAPKLLFLLAVLITGGVDAQTIYHCTKNGKKIVSNSNCQDQGAIEKKHVDMQDMPPLNISQSLTPLQVQQSQQISQRLQQQRRIDDQNREYQRALDQRQQVNNQSVCKDLEQHKQRVIAQQRAHSTDGLTAERRRVDDELYRLRCETL